MNDILKFFLILILSMNFISCLKLPMPELLNDKISEERTQIEKIFKAYNIKLDDLMSTSVRTYTFYSIDEKNMTSTDYLLQKEIILRSGWRYIGNENFSELFCNKENTLLEVSFPPTGSHLKNGHITAQVQGEWGVTLLRRIGGYDVCKMH